MNNYRRPWGSRRILRSVEIKILKYRVSGFFSEKINSEMSDATLKHECIA